MTTNFKGKEKRRSKVSGYTPKKSEFLEDLPLVTQQEYDEYAKSVFSIGDVVTNFDGDVVEDLDVNEILYKLINKVNELETKLEEYQKQTEIDVTYLEGLVDEMYEESDEIWTAIDDIEEDLAYLSDTKDSEETVTALEAVYLLSQYDEDLNQVISDINGLYDQVNAIEEKLGAEEEESEPLVIDFEHLENVETLNLFYHSKIIYKSPSPDIEINLNTEEDAEEDKEFLDGYEGEFEDPDNEIYDETKYGSEDYIEPTELY